MSFGRDEAQRIGAERTQLRPLVPVSERSFASAGLRGAPQREPPRILKSTQYRWRLAAGPVYTLWPTSGRCPFSPRDGHTALQSRQVSFHASFAQTWPARTTGAMNGGCGTCTYGCRRVVRGRSPTGEHFPAVDPSLFCHWGLGWIRGSMPSRADRRRKCCAAAVEGTSSRFTAQGPRPA